MVRKEKWQNKSTGEEEEGKGRGKEDKWLIGVLLMAGERIWGFYNLNLKDQRCIIKEGIRMS